MTAAAYSACVEGRRCTPAGTDSPNCTFGRSKRLDHPINCVNFEQAERFCAARGARLPSEAEWEFAARGGAAAQRYPWGNAQPSRSCVLERGATHLPRRALSGGCLRPVRPFRQRLGVDLRLLWSLSVAAPHITLQGLSRGKLEPALREMDAHPAAQPCGARAERFPSRISLRADPAGCRMPLRCFPRRPLPPRGDHSHLWSGV